MSITSIAQHHQKWSDLPLFTDQRWVVTDDDIQAWSDILHCRTLVDEIEDLCELRGVLPPLMRSVEFDIDLYIDPWPTDIAGMLIDSWKAAAA